MTETYWCPGPWPWQWARMCTRDVPDPSPDPSPDPCDTPACVSAQGQLAEARGRFASNCSGLRWVNAVMKLVKQVISAPIWIVLVMAAVAVIVFVFLGGVIAVIIWALIAAYGISWVLVFVLGRVAGSVAASLEQARKDVIAALRNVAASCPEQCRGDVSIPTCSLD